MVRFLSSNNARGKGPAPQPTVVLLVQGKMAACDQALRCASGSQSRELGARQRVTGAGRIGPLHRACESGETSERPDVILELADIRVHPGQGDAFAEAIVRGLTTVIARAQGFQGYKVNRGIENPERFILQIFWNTLEDHTVHFRGGPLFPEWRAIVGPFFAAPPVVEHFDLVSRSQ